MGRLLSDEILLGLIQSGGDYNQLSNKPQINSVTLSGNKTSADLSLVNNVTATINANNVLTLNLLSGSTQIATCSVTIPTASIVESVYFDYSTNEIVIVFTNGQTLRFSLTNLISSLIPMAINFTIETSAWTQIGSSTSYQADITSQANAILGQMYTYTAVTPVGTENPSEEGWYEKNSDNEYVLTEDTTVQSGKTYFTRAAKTLNGTYQFDLSATDVAQAVIDAGSAYQYFCHTTKENGTWKLYCMAIGGKPNSQIVLPATMVVVAPSVTDMSLIGQPVYKSISCLSTDTWGITFTDGTTATSNYCKK